MKLKKLLLFRKKLLILLWVSFSFLFLFPSCGYKVGVKQEFPGGVKNVAIPTFKNKTYEAGMESEFTRALRYEFLKSQNITLVNKDEAEAIVYGTINSFSITPGGEESKNFPGNIRQTKKIATNHTATVIVSIEIRDKKDEVLWKNDFTESEAYSVNEDFKNDAKTNRHLKNERNQREAIKEAAADMMEAVHDQLFMRF